MNHTTHMTVKLMSDHMIGAHHLPKGTKVTLGLDRAKELVRLGIATKENFDATALPPQPSPRPFIKADGTPSQGV